MSHNPDHVIIIGADSPLLREVARLAVAYGADVTAFVPEGKPEVDEAWVQGVRWKDAFGGELPELASTVIRLGPAAAEVDSSLKVVACAGARGGSVELPPIDYESGPIPDAETLQTSATVRVETIAMAVLRAALEEERVGQLTREEVLHLGDAMMWQ